MLMSIPRFSRWLRASSSACGRRFRASSTSYRAVGEGADVRLLIESAGGAAGMVAAVAVCASHAGLLLSDGRLPPRLQIPAAPVAAIAAAF